MKIKHLILEMIDEQSIRIAAWLYMIVYPYRGSMKIDSWKNDNRMGINFIDAVKILERLGLANIDNDKIVSTTKSKPYLLKIFNVIDNEDDVVEFGKKLKKYDTIKYGISSIPYDIFESEYEMKVKRDIQELYRHKYEDIISFIKKHQRTPSSAISIKFRDFFGDENLVDRNKLYRLYRGIYITN